MAKNITVAASAAPWVKAQAGQGPQDITETILRHIEATTSCLVAQNPDILVLPEMCSYADGLTQQEYLAYIDEQEPYIRQALCQKAQAAGIYIVYPTARRLGDGGHVNTALLLTPDGGVAGAYNKNYLTAGEIEAGMQAGGEPLVLDTPLGRLGFAICFDLNFTRLLAAYKKARPDVLLFPSAFHGGLLQSWWAFESRAYFVGAAAGQGASVVAPTGEVVAESTSQSHGLVHRLNLDRALVHLDFNQDKIKAAQKKYGPGLCIYNPGRLGAVLLTCETDGCTIQDLLAEFEIETLDEYLTKFSKQ